MAGFKGRLSLNVGYAEWDYKDLVLVGDRTVPSRIEVHFLGGEENPQPALDFTIEIQDGVPTCSTLTVFQREGGRGVNQSDLRDVRLLDWMEEIVSGASRPGWIADDGSLASVISSDPEEERRARKATRNMQRGGRRKIDEKHLRRVAEIYRDHEGDGAVDAVSLAFGTSYRSAARWVQKAREEGLL